MNLTLGIWWAGMLGESLLVFRALRTRLFVRYVYFFVYLASVLFCDVALYAILVFARPLYPVWDARADCVNYILGYGLILEIFRHALASYRGAKKLAETLWIVTLAVICAILVFYHFSSQAAFGFEAAKVQFERNLLIVQALFLIAALFALARYRIPLGRNLRGMIYGYGLCLATSVITLGIQFSRGVPITELWRVVQPLSFLISLFIWMVALWSPHPDPVPDPQSGLDEDYEALISRTRGVMRYVVSHLRSAG